MRPWYDIGPGSDDDEPYSQELTALRLAVMRAEPSVMFDGRFEEMFSSPAAVFEIACALLDRLTFEQSHCECGAAQSPGAG